MMYVYLKQNDLSSAKEFASAALGIAYSNGYRALVRDICYQIGSHYKKNGEEKIAEVFFEKACNADGRITLDIMKQVNIDLMNSGGYRVEVE
jgi:hypothetical protein